MKDDEQTFWLENLQNSDHYTNWIFSQIIPHLGSEVLEVGCGNGNFTVLLAERCSRVMAVDINEKYVRATKARLKRKSGVEVLLADATQKQFNTCFDTVVMLDVLEHIENDVKMLDQLRNCLNPGGKMIVKVPALDFLYSPMDKAIGHYRRYSKRTLSSSLRKAGFSKQYLWYFNLVGIVGWWLNGYILNRTIPPSEQIGIFNTLVPLLRPIESLVKPPIGLSLFAIGIRE